MSTLIWKGALGLQEQPDLVEEYTWEKNSQEVSYKGPYAVCQANTLVVGYRYSSTGYIITKVRCARLPGGMGLLTFSLDWALNIVPPPNPGVTIEVDWCPQMIDLLQHPRYATGGIDELTTEDRVALALWTDEADYNLKKTFKFHKGVSAQSGIGTLSQNAQACATKLIKGETDYRTAWPVVSRTQRIAYPTHSDTCWVTVDLPPDVEAASPTGCEWVKSSDKFVRSGNGKWERHEEWMGVPIDSGGWDDDIYGGSFLSAARLDDLRKAAADRATARALRAKSKPQSPARKHPFPARVTAP